MRFIVGLVAGILIIAIAGGLLVYGGRMSIAANTPPDMLDRFAPVARDRAIARNATSLSIPADPARAARGMEHYGENCLPCHGAPTVKPAEFAQGMNPAPPDLDSSHTQAYSDGELFWIVRNGIRASGMPGFGVNHEDAEIQDIVGFVRHLPSLTAEEKKQLAAAGPRDEHHHEDATAAPGAAPPHHQH